MRYKPSCGCSRRLCKLDQAKRDVKNGTLQANAVGSYEANLAAATTQLGQATLSAAASGAAAAHKRGPAVFTPAAVQKKPLPKTIPKNIGSNFNVGGDATF